MLGHRVVEQEVVCRTSLASLNLLQGFVHAQVMVTNFDSISTRRMTTAMWILTEKKMVAMSDYGDEHRMLKKMVVGNLLGITTQVDSRALLSVVSFETRSMNLNGLF